MADWMNSIRAQGSRQDAMIAQSKLGEVIAYDPDKALAKVRILPDGNITGWIPVGTLQAGKGVGFINPPQDGERVLVQPIQGDSNSWVLTTRLHTVSHTPPISSGTKKPVQQGEMAMVTSGAIIHLVGDTVYVEAKTIKSKGLWEHDGDVTITGKLDAKGIIKSLSDVIAKTVSLFSHVHKGVQPGGGLSGPPA